MGYQGMRAALTASVAICAVASPSPAWAQTRTFDVPAQSAATGIPELARQADIQILVSESAVRGKATREVKGRMSVEQALQRLIAGTGLRIASSDGRTYTLSPETAAVLPSPKTQAMLRTENEVPEANEVIVVIGSHLSKAAGEEGPAPVTVFNTEQIQNIGATSVSGVLRYLPQQPFTRAEFANAGGAQNAQIRGLSLGTTLVLINGRRAVTSAVAGANPSFDLNTIPLAAVERIEVLADSASALYGADAVGGVVNIVLKSHIPRPNLEVYFGGASGGAEERRVSLSAGADWGRFRGGAIFDIYRRDFLEGFKRDIFADQDYRRFGGADSRSATTNPANISSLTGANLPGLNSSFAAVPVGSTGIGLTPADFLATAGQRNLQSLNAFQSIIPRSKRTSVFGWAEYEFSESFSAFADVLYANRYDLSLTAPASYSGTVPASNPFNPFDAPVRVTYLFAGIGPVESLTEAESIRATVGTRGRVGSWNWEASLAGFKEDTENNLSNRVDAGRVAASLAATDPSQSLNVFRDGPGGSNPLLLSLLAPPSLSSFASEMYQLAAIARGPLFSLPAGSIQVALGGEARTEKIEFFASGLALASPNRRTASAFGELNVPILNSSMALPFMHSLTATLAARYDTYNDFGSAFNPQIGLVWELTPRLMLRGSYGTAFRAPTLFQIYRGRTEGPPGNVLDPRRNEVVPVTLRSGGNPNLAPETSESYSIGFVARPFSNPHLKLSASYWNVSQDDRHQSFPSTLVLANESIFPERLIRETPTPADVAAGLPGRLISVDTTPINFGSLKTSGIDLDLVTRFDVGSWTISPTMRATHVFNFTTVDIPGTAPFNRVGIGNSSGTVPSWRIVGNIGGQLGGTSFSVSGRYTSSYLDTNSLRQLTGRRIPSQFYIDAQIAIKMEKILPSIASSGLDLRLGATNLFDVKPSYSEVIGIGVDPSMADVRGRFIYASLSKSF